MHKLRDFNKPSSRMHIERPTGQLRRARLLPSILPRVKVRRRIGQVYAGYTKDPPRIYGLFATFATISPGTGLLAGWFRIIISMDIEEHFFASFFATFGTGTISF